MLRRQSPSAQQRVSTPALIVGRAANLLFTALAGLICCSPAPYVEEFPTEPPPTQPMETEAPEPSALPVWTIAQEAPLGDHPTEPFYTVVARPDEWSELQGRLPPVAIQAGVQAGPEDGSVIVVGFGGAKGSSGHSLTVESVVQDGDRVIVTISQQAPDPDAIREPAMTLPYHLVAIPTEALDLPRGLTFEFRDQAGLVLSHKEVVLP
jgi:hypothetical protein